MESDTSRNPVPERRGCKDQQNTHLSREAYGGRVSELKQQFERSHYQEEV